MKTFKKMMALVIAMVMTLAMVVPAMAEDPAPTTYKISITKDSSDKSAHTYGAYQIFTGKLAESIINIMIMEIEVFLIDHQLHPFLHLGNTLINGIFRIVDSLILKLQPPTVETICIAEFLKEPDQDIVYAFGCIFLPI